MHFYQYNSPVTDCRKLIYGGHECSKGFSVFVLKLMSLVLVLRCAEKWSKCTLAHIYMD
jgi:hypothetical protein